MKTHHNRGMALLGVVVLLSVALIMLSTMAWRFTTQHNQLQRQESIENTLQGVESTIAMSLAEITNGDDGFIGLTPAQWAPVEMGEPLDLPTFDDDDLTPLTLNSNPTIRALSVVQSWEDDGIDNNADGYIDDITEENIVTIYARSISGNIEKTVELLGRKHTYNIWNNALFGGQGTSSGVIANGATIHGSVHVLGDNIPYGGIAFGGSDFAVRNHYATLPSSLQSRLPSLGTRLWNETTVSTLEARVYSRNGRANLSGDFPIGEEQDSRLLGKNTVDGTYLNDGWTGTNVEPNQSGGVPSTVYSDNSYTHDYIFGERAYFPTMDSDYINLNTGQPILVNGSNNNYTHQDYFKNVLTGAEFNGNIEITTDSDFYFNASQPGSTSPENRLPTDDYIYFEHNTNQLVINGQIEISGDLSFTPSTDSSKLDETKIYYSGSAAILVHGDVTINTSLLTGQVTLPPEENNGNNGNNEEENSEVTISPLPFPNNVLGIMTVKDLHIEQTIAITGGEEEEDKLIVMGAFYAQSSISIADGVSSISGTMVANVINLGNEVPDLYQVPTLETSLPEGMISVSPIIAIERLTWRELK